MSSCIVDVYEKAFAMKSMLRSQNNSYFSKKNTGYL